MSTGNMFIKVVGLTFQGKIENTQKSNKTNFPNILLLQDRIKNCLFTKECIYISILLCIINMTRRIE